MNTDSQQATTVTPHHTQNNRRLSECCKNKVLPRPIFSIGHMKD